METDMNPRAYPLFRLLTSGIFILAGLQHLVRPDAVAGRLVDAPMAHLVTGLASPQLLVILSGFALFIGGIALALGLATRAAAVGLALVLIPITLTVQVGAESAGPLLKNVALMGSLVLLAAQGGGHFSVDRLVAGRRRGIAASAAGVVALGLGLGTIPLVASDASAAPAAEKGAKVLLLVQQPPQLRAAMATGIELLDGKGFPATEVEVLVCGPGVSELLAGSATEPRIQEAARAGVRVVACGLTLKEKGIDPKKVSPLVTVVENGFVEALERKHEGYISVDL